MSGIFCWGIIILGIAVAVIIWKSLEDFRNNLFFAVGIAMGVPIHIVVWIIRKIWPVPESVLANWRVLGKCDDGLRISIGTLIYTACPYIVYYLRYGRNIPGTLPNILVLMLMLGLGFFAGGLFAGSLSKFWHPMGRHQAIYNWFGIQDTDSEEELNRKRLTRQLWEKVKDTNVPQLLRALIEGKGDFDGIVKELADYPDRETVVELLALNLENTDLMDPTISLSVAHIWGDALVAMGKDAVERLIACLDHENWWVRIAAISALGRIGDRRAIQPFIKILQEAPYGRTASIVADYLALIAEPDPEVINVLKETLERKETWPAPFAEAALDRWKQKAREVGEDK